MSQDKIIYPTWSALLLNLIIDATEKWRAQNYVGSWDTMQVLYSWMPEVCVEECKKTFEDFIDNFAKNCKVSEYDINTANTKLLKLTNRYLYLNLLNLFTVTRKSLEKHGYLGKDIGAKPRYGSEGTL